MMRLLYVLLAGLAGVMTILAQPVTPPTPANLTAQSISGNFPRVMLSWEAPLGPWYFIAYRSDGDSLHFRPIGFCPGVTFEDRAVQAGRTYFYELGSVAFVDTGFVESPLSNIARVTLGPPGGGARGTIRGTVVDDSTGRPIGGVRIRFFRQPGNVFPVSDITDSSGRYEAAVDTGRYLIKAEPPMEHQQQPFYGAEYYDNAPDPSSATSVPVGNGSTSVANFGLRRVNPVRYASIEGIVSTTQGNPLPNASVVILRSIQEMNYLAATTGLIPGLGNEAVNISGIGYVRGRIWSGVSDSRGNYHAMVPANGSYIALAGKLGYALQYFDHVNDPTRATIISAAAETVGVNFSLRPLTGAPNILRGTVRDTSGSNVPSRVILFPRPIGTEGSPSRVVHSDANGNYEIGYVESGSYLVLSVPYSNYAPAFYKAGAFGIAQWQLADSVTVSGSVGNVDVGLLPVYSNGLTRVSGTAMSTTGEPIAGARVIARLSSGTVVGVGLTTSTGGYRVDALASGAVRVGVDRDAYNPYEVGLTIPPNLYTLENVDFRLTRTSPTLVENLVDVPARFDLRQNYPNPFNPGTSIRYSVPVRARVTLKVYDLLGRDVATLVDELQGAGDKVVSFDAKHLSSGVYVYRLTTGGLSDVRKMVLVR